MIRWKYVIPRLAFLLILVLALTFGAGPLLHWTLVTSGEAVVGAKVDIGAVDADWMGTRLEIREVQIADRGNPMTNLIQADRMQIDFDAFHLLRKRFVIEQATLEGVQFGTIRETSGALEPVDPSAEPTWTDEIVDSASDAASRRFDAWLEELKVAGLEQLESELETVRLAKEMAVRWPREYSQLKDRVTAIEERVQRIRGLVDRPNNNPLRVVQTFNQAAVDVQQTLADAEALKVELQRLSQQLPRDRQLLLEAQQRDRSKLRTLVQLPKIDSETITDAIFGKDQGDQIQEVMSWVQWVRAVVPNPDTDFNATRTDGIDVHFSGTKEHPLFWLQEAALTGSLDRGLTRTEFSGQLFDLTSHPRLLGRPMRLEINTTGDSPTHMLAIIDRTTDVHRDQIVIELPRIPMGERHLGKSESIAMAIPAGFASVTLNLTLVDRQIDGRLDIHREGSGLEVRHVSDRLGGTYVHGMIGSALESLDELEATILITGELKKPEFKLESEIGPQIAARLNDTATTIVTDQLSRVEQRVNREIEEEIANLEQKFGELDQLRQLIGGYQSQLSTIKDTVARVTGLGRLR